MITKIGTSNAARRRRKVSTTMVVVTALVVAATGYLASALQPNQTVASLAMGRAGEQRDVRQAEASTPQIRFGQSSGSMPAPSSNATVGNVIDMTY